MKKFQELKNTIIKAEEDAVKFFEKGNQTAGRRLRKALQSIKNLAQQERVHVSELKNK